MTVGSSSTLEAEYFLGAAQVRLRLHREGSRRPSHRTAAPSAVVDRVKGAGRVPAPLTLFRSSLRDRRGSARNEEAIHHGADRDECSEHQNGSPALARTSEKRSRQGDDRDGDRGIQQMERIGGGATSDEQEEAACGRHDHQAHDRGLEALEATLTTGSALNENKGPHDSDDRHAHHGVCEHTMDDVDEVLPSRLQERRMPERSHVIGSRSVLTFTYFPDWPHLALRL